MNKLKSFIFLLILVTFDKFNVLGQNTQYTSGVPVRIKDYTDIQGSPFLNDEWVVGQVKLEEGKIYNDVYLKYNQLEDQIYYRGNDNIVMTFNDLIKEFTFINLKNVSGNNMLFRNGYPSTQNTSGKAYFEVLADGKMQFLKRTIKQILDSKEYNSATTNRNIVESSKYYFFYNGNIIITKRDKKSILSSFPDKQAELSTYVSSNNLNFKDEKDIIKLVDFYNSNDKL